ncbi:hypothetical protein FGG08_004675 [Glutinoglossum americanum]|uniref:RRM domain-containing protein n=1 Tax=Glutinoglossum americanum TaxID=1670608 RepID=A0A9P8KZ98_9PEZI|nr:hypothetical protein FGG08_004675 [Glutinoglossum americanum]
MESNNQFGLSSSPHSSNGAEVNSHHGSPETSLSAFSSEQPPVSFAEGTAVATYALNAAHFLPGFLTNPSAAHPPQILQLGNGSQFPESMHDPFVGNVSSLVMREQKLSPTASAFQPFGSTSVGQGAPITDTASRARDFLKATIASSSPRNNLPLRLGIENSTRYLIISNIDKATAPKELREFFTAREFPSLKGLETLKLSSAGIIYLGFWDIRDAEKAFRKAETEGPEWDVEYYSRVQYAQVLTQTTAFVSAYESQLLVTAVFRGSSDTFDAAGIQHMLQEALARFGDMKSYQNLNDNEPGVVRIVVEFFDTRESDDALQALKNYKFQSCILSTCVYEPDCAAYSPALYHTLEGGSGGTPQTDMEIAMHQLGLRDRRPSKDSAFASREGSLGGFSNGFGVRLSPTGRSQLPPDEPSAWSSLPGLPGTVIPRRRGRTEAYPPSFGNGRYWEDYRNNQGIVSLGVHGVIGQERGLLRQSSDYLPSRYSGQNRGTHNRVVARHDQDYTAGHHNVVDIERIRRGLDVRTTAMLKEIVDETSAGKYDFMYLRIDFANNCNLSKPELVGAGKHDMPFVSNFALRAAAYHKIGTGSIVTKLRRSHMRGKDCLVQKFRNSSVMLEHPSFRPKATGQEDEFPGPDNPSKMRRSVENAEHVGLFAPRAGQHFRDEQRRRRSQYDRGTRLAEMEEAYDYDAQDQFDEDYYQQSLRYGIFENGRGNSRRAGRFDGRY